MKAFFPGLQGFTLIEMLTGIVVAAILVGMMLTMTSLVSTTVRTADNKMDAFQSAQAGFDLMTQKLSDATLNTYYDYDVPAAPKTYIRRSDLHFFIAQNASLNAIFPAANADSGQSVFFQVPAGYSNNAAYANTQGLLNACGYFVQFGTDQNYWPSIFAGGNAHYRYRLMQTIQSTELNGIFTDAEGTTPETSPAWISSLSAGALPVAENVIALIIWPRRSPTEDASTGATPISSDYQYNSRQGLPTPAVQIQSEQLPPILQLTMVAIDANSAARLENGSTPPAVIQQALAGKFTATANYNTDMTQMETMLTAAKIRYEVLTSSITLRESKWSSGQ
jgi:uncharacterized protein (TIGR02599 family)